MNVLHIIIINMADVVLFMRAFLSRTFLSNEQMSYYYCLLLLVFRLFIYVPILFTIKMKRFYRDRRTDYTSAI